MPAPLLNPKAKRRRLDEGASALSRPFKSPLRKEVQQAETVPKDHAATVVNDEERKNRRTVSNPAFKPIMVNQNSKARRLRQPSSPDSDPETAALRKKRIALQSQLTSLRSELDTAQQALRIESSPRDEELKTLIVKWRSISQKAADELFEAAKDKVERMGGVTAWKENERERMKRAQMWEDEDFYEGSECSANRNESTTISERRSELKGAGAEETFTMDMMLKSLNIELDIIGFDEAEERWVSNQ